MNWLLPLRVNQPGGETRGIGVTKSRVRPGDLQGDDGAFAHEHREFIQREVALDLCRPRGDLIVVEEIAPAARGERHGPVELVGVDRRDQQFVAKQVMVFALRLRPHERRRAVVALHHVRIHVGHQLGVQPGELADDLQLRPGPFPQAALTVAPIQEQAAEGRELRPANIDVRGDGVICRRAKIISRRRRPRSRAWTSYPATRKWPPRYRPGCCGHDSPPRRSQ